MNYQQNIRNSSLRFKLRKTAIQLASKWHECAKNMYKYSYHGEFVYDELDVENDLVEYLSNAIESLVNNKSIEKKSKHGWSFGYICGHTQGALNVKWSHQYLVEPSKEFEDLIKIKTIIKLLRTDSDVSRKIGVIYDHFTAHRNSAIKEEVLPDNVISLIQRGKIKTENKVRYKKDFDKYFEKLFMINYTSLLRTYDLMCCPDLTAYLNEDEIINLVGAKHFS